MGEPTKPYTRFINTQEDWAAIDLQPIKRETIYFVDKDGKFWFSDETEAGAYGAYDSLDIAKQRAHEYGETL